MKITYRKMALVLVVCILVCLSGNKCGAETSNCDVADKTGLPSDVCTFDLRMKGAHPRKADEYYCAGYDVENEILPVSDGRDADGYVVRYEALADADTAHHILVFGCKSLRRDTSKIWHCGQVCDGEDQIIFAWAKNAPPLTLPKDVGQHIGTTTDIRYIVIQIHYAKPLSAPDTSGIRLYTTRQRQPYISGIYLLLAFGITIPQNTPKFHVNSSCRFNWLDSIVPFGYRTHAHSLCEVISGYKVHDGEYEMIGKGNPQWPQAFYPVENQVAINPGDILAAQCTYNSTGRYRATQIGSTANDEMCNFYIMYYMNSSMENMRGQDTCYQNMQSQVFRNIPDDSDIPLPPNPALEGSAMAHHHHHGMGGSNEDDDDTHGKIDEPEVDNEQPQVDFHGKKPNVANPGNGILRNSYGSEGKLPTSFGDSLLDDVYGQGYRNKGSGYSGLDMRRPPSYLMDYPGLDDFYNEVVQQRSRNRLKKPIYDIYDSPDYDVGFSEFPKKSYPALSRNRNKLFNDKYDEYAAGAISNPPNSEVKSFSSSKSDSQSRHGVVKVTPKQNQSEEALHGTDMSSKDVKLNKDLDMQFISEVGSLKIGQVGGLAVNPAGDLYIFHRGSNIWTQLSFTPMNVYTQKNLPVSEDPVVILDKNGILKRHFGKNRFYLPHGLSLDSEENIWLTDVALHQVFRIPRGGVEPDMTLGIKFEPGTDNEHFCKPSDVAVLSTGEFFVSDGYCNSRIMKFDKNGYFLKQWGAQSASWGSDGFPPPGTFNLPHGLALAEEKGLLCVADRENGRIQCFDLEGKFVRQMHPKKFGKALYSLEYCPNHGGVLFAVNGPLFGAHSEITQGFTLDINTGNLVSMWNVPREGMTHPHDVTVDSTNHMVYVGELNPSKVWKFQMSKKMYSADKPTDVTRPAGGKIKPVSVTGTSKQVSKETKKEEESDGFGPSVIIGTLLVVPVLLLVIITVIVRLYHTGRFKNWRRRSGKKSVFSLGNFLHSHKGFDRLSTEDDDHDYDNVLDEDSDNEEFNIVRKA